MRAGLLLLLAAGCAPAATPDPCADAGARSTCLEPVKDPSYYAAMSSQYFDTMDYTVELEDWPPYAEQVVRWEWPPWLLLTAMGREDMEAADTMLRLYPSVVRERDCQGFDTQPFGRCRVVFYYDAHEGLGCPIYEEFSFDDDGRITWIEAWSDVDGLRPTSPGDPWGEAGIHRLSTRIPGLGAPEGLADLDGPWMQAAAGEDPEVADFLWRARDWHAAWLEAWAATDDDFWAEGCGW